MKLKCRPEDFVVEELTDRRPAQGPLALYRLSKRGIGTPEAITAILERWNLPRHVVAYGGLKDRHALTSQYLTIDRGPRRGLHQNSFDLEYLGQTAQPFHSQDILANRFSVVVRDLSSAAADSLLARCQHVKQHGVPNYFDEQRFGSVTTAGEFIAVPWCKGDHEHALKLVILEPNPHDRPDDMDAKRILRENWGDWLACKDLLPRSHTRSIVTYLVDHPTDFRGAIARVRQDLRSLYLSAFQSEVWNRVLSQLIEQTIPSAERDQVLINGHPHWFHQQLTGEGESLRRMSLPLPSARLHDLDARLQPLYESVLAHWQLELREMRVKYPRDSFFSKGDRAAVVQPLDFAWTSSGDELYERRQKVELRFQLPRGAYATIIIKRLTEEPAESLTSE